MTRDSTYNSLLLLKYGELSSAEHAALFTRTCASPEAASYQNEINLTTPLLDGELYRPSHTSLKIVLQHSCKTEHLQES